MYTAVFAKWLLHLKLATSPFASYPSWTTDRDSGAEKATEEHENQTSPPPRMVSRNLILDCNNHNRVKAVFLMILLGSDDHVLCICAIWDCMKRNAEPFTDIPRTSCYFGKKAKLSASKPPVPLSTVKTTRIREKKGETFQRQTLRSNPVNLPKTHRVNFVSLRLQIKDYGTSVE